MRAFAAMLVGAAGLLAAVGAPAADFPWTDDERAYLAAKGPIRMCVAPDWAPMESVDASGRHVGIGADFIALMAKRGGLDVQRVPTATWDESYARAKARECDIFSMAMASPERRTFMDFTTPYVEVPGVIVTREDVAYVASVVQVLDKKLGIVHGFAGVELLRAQYPGIDLVEVRDYEHGLGLVQSGEIFGMLGNMAGIGLVFQRHGIKNLKIAGWVGSSSRMSVATRNDEPMLGRVFERLVQAVEPAERQAILNHWLAVRFEQGFDYRLFWRSLAVFVLVAAAVLAWALTLRRLNGQLREANARLDEAGRRDGLTGLHNRLHLDHELAARLPLCSRNGLVLALAMIDIDHFKRLNDGHGHPFGDAALRHVAAILRRRFKRETDTTVRYGGEEFIVLAVGGTREEAVAQMRELLREIEESAVVHDGHEARLTVSIGLYADVPHASDTPMRLLQLADAALYDAKRAGRNRLVVHGERAPAPDAVAVV